VGHERAEGEVMSMRTRSIVMMVALCGCYESDAGVREDGESGTGTGTMSAGSTTDETTPGTSVTQGSTPGTTMPDESSSGEPVDPGEYNFDDAPPEEFDQIDRMGMPAISTAVITSKDLYNASSPFDDSEGMFIDELTGNVTMLHAALDDDLTMAGLVPCEVGVCVAQVGPLVLPDTLKITLGEPPGFPNGRLPDDTVIVLLDLPANGQTATTLVGTNPTENDKAFLDDFPYFAERF
jgi:hypothetical protein